MYVYMFMYFKRLLLRLRLLICMRQQRHLEQQEEEQQLLDRYWARSLAGYHSLVVVSPVPISKELKTDPKHTNNCMDE